MEKDDKNIPKLFNLESFWICFGILDRTKARPFLSALQGFELLHQQLQIALCAVHRDACGWNHHGPIGAWPKSIKHVPFQNVSNTIQIIQYFHILPYTSIYFHILPYTSIYLHIPPYTSIYFHILPYTSISFDRPYLVWYTLCTF